MSVNKKILILTYYWPPSGGAGVQRWLKFSKYLPDFGWKVSIVTVDPEYAEFPAWDESLVKDINPQLKVFPTKSKNYYSLFSGRSTVTKKNNVSPKTKRKSLRNKLARFIRGNLFIPDPRKGWNKYALAKASELIKLEGIRYIVTTGPPHSTHLIGRQLKRLYPELSWVADFRDPWTDIYYYKDFYGSPIARRKDKNFESSVLEEADIILTIGEGMTELLRSKSDRIIEKVYTLSNGFDEEDFQGLSLETKHDDFVITYVGTISDQYPLEPFLIAIRDLITNNPGKKFILRFVGQISPVMLDLIKAYNLLQLTELIDYSTHEDAIKYIITADLLLLLIPDHERNNVIITGKIFEYIRSGKSILGIGPVEGDASRVLLESGSGMLLAPDNITGIKQSIENRLHNENVRDQELKLSGYERRFLTSKLDKLLNK